MVFKAEPRNNEHLQINDDDLHVHSKIQQELHQTK